MMRNKLIFILFIFLYFELHAQNENGFSVVFYNVENLFDWKDDPATEDDEFTPEGARHWTYNRFEQRIKNTAKVLINTNGWDTPALVGLCEVENREVLERLNNETPLKRTGYKIIHKESPDPRGIDVALLYNPDVFYPIGYDYFPLRNDDGSVRQTREILYVSGILAGLDTLHVFINHWPSRYSGLLETRPWRNKAATLLREKVDSILMVHQHAKIVIMGDFNDQPEDESIQRHLKAGELTAPPKPRKLYNLSLGWAAPDVGTLKYQSQWNTFDQIIVSGALLGAKGIYTKPGWATIIDNAFLFEQDERYGGRKLKRTYIGYTYNGGFSDHLPVKLKLGTR
ncbi:endonuclease/exonuclease/phosphatase family protein [Maribellus sediminis]|uniref:endonuclease/exonuclease/phosphatase family protein n=1 Tax=Maribellus sediminis TaxID=2696285 RepID=UPI001431443F|nr:endonuclease/exonuclease/phosphatase family protein [Maribellus sediminis]